MSKIGGVEVPTLKMFSNSTNSFGTFSVIEGPDGRLYALGNQHVQDGTNGKGSSSILQGKSPAGDSYVPRISESTPPTLQIGNLKVPTEKAIADKGTDLSLAAIPREFEQKIRSILGDIPKLPVFGEKPKESTLTAVNPAPKGNPQGNVEVASSTPTTNESGVKSKTLNLERPAVAGGASGTGIKGESTKDGEGKIFQVINSTTGSPDSLQSQAVATDLTGKEAQKTLKEMFGRMGTRFDTFA
jgi:hypothetical protein